MNFRFHARLSLPPLARLAPVLLTGLLLLAPKLAAADDPPPPNQPSPVAVRAKELEAARVRSFLDARYKESDVRYSFRTRLGDTIDCIDFFAQPGVKMLAARGAPILKPPPAVTRARAPGALFDSAPDENGNVRQCPDSTVPQVRITVPDIERAGGLSAYLSRIKKFAFSPPSRVENRRVDRLAPPDFGAPDYAHTYIFATGNNFTSTEAALSVWTPAIPLSDTADHSLEQTWTTAGENNSSKVAQCTTNCRQTIEAGWTVDPGLNSDVNPHLFVYSTPDGYWTGCYNGSIPGNLSKITTCPAWIGFPFSTYPPGITLASSTPGINGIQQIFVWVGRCSVYHECENGWEVRVSDDLDGSHYVGVGYYPDSDFGGNFPSAANFAAGGEVFDQTGTFVIPMGSGSPATAGLGTAGYVANVYTVGPGGQGLEFNGGFGAPFSTVQASYAAWQNPNPGGVEIDLGIDYYLGAVAPPNPPPPPKPTCTPHSATSQDQFYVNVNNNPVQVEQGYLSAVDLILDGPWIVGDHGNNALGNVTNDNLPAGSSAWTTPASADVLGHSYALMQFSVTVPFSANPGSYLATVQATDLNSCVVATTTVPITVLSCNPQKVCPQGAGGPYLCGAISNGCGGTVNCGACASGQTCSNGYCCAAGSTYNTVLNTCEPPCPTGTSFCYEMGTCTTDAKCKQKVYCQKVGSLKECE